MHDLVLQNCSYEAGHPSGWLPSLLNWSDGALLRIKILHIEISMHGLIMKDCGCEAGRPSGDLLCALSCRNYIMFK